MRLGLKVKDVVGFVALDGVRVDVKVLLRAGEFDEADASDVVDEQVLRKVHLGVVAVDADLEELVGAELVVAYVERVARVLPVVLDGETIDARKRDLDATLFVVDELEGRLLSHPRLDSSVEFGCILVELSSSREIRVREIFADDCCCC